MARSTARAAAMQLIFESLVGGDGGDESLEMIYEAFDKESERKPSDKDLRYITQLFEGVTAHLGEIDETIERYADNWRIERMAKVDLSILRLGIFEMQYCDDVPVNVVINEAVELANCYSDPSGSRFVNGLLGSIDRNTRKEP